MVSLITTVYNEEKGIRDFITALINQTVLPDEFIIVDAGSTDKTVEILKSYQDKFTRVGTKLQVIVSNGANRSVGRNNAITQACGDIIAVIDAGCKPKPNWLSEITKPLITNQAQVVSGYYLPETKSDFEKCVAPYFCVMPDRIGPEGFSFEFLPSSRSVAFTKTAWNKAAGYPDTLNYCEDLVFDQKLKQAGFRFYFAPKAVVSWPQRHTLRQVFWQFYHYAYGDGMTFFNTFQTHSLKVVGIFGRYFGAVLLTYITWSFFRWQDATIVLAICLIAYFIFSIHKNYRYIRKPIALFWLPVLQVTGDLAVMAGSIAGIVHSIRVK